MKQMEKLQEEIRDCYHCIHLLETLTPEQLNSTPEIIADEKQEYLMKIATLEKQLMRIRSLTPVTPRIRFAMKMV